MTGRETAEMDRIDAFLATVDLGPSRRPDLIACAAAAVFPPDDEHPVTLTRCLHCGNPFPNPCLARYCVTCQSGHIRQAPAPLPPDHPDYWARVDGEAMMGPWVQVCVVDSEHDVVVSTPGASTRLGTFGAGTRVSARRSMTTFEVGVGAAGDEAGIGAFRVPIGEHVESTVGGRFVWFEVEGDRDGS